MAASETTAQEFTVTRTFNAPRDVVWKAWTERDALEEWWGPKGCAIEVEAFEASPGGAFHYAMQMPDGAKWWGIFRYEELVKPARIVFINSFSNEAGEITRAPFSDNWPKEIRNVVTFHDDGDKMRLELRGRPINTSAEEQAMFESMFGSMQQGFGGTFDQLDDYLATQK
jgi:uncharacterized protein YndB with AHSA1/START domain